MRLRILPWLASAFLALTLRSAKAHAASCFDVIQVVGAAEDVVRVQTALARGLLSRLPAEGCAGAELALSDEQGRWQFRLSRGAVDVEHDVAELGALLAWVESWLATPAPPTAATASVEPPPDTGAGSVTLESARLTPPELALSGFVDVDSHWPVSPGAELAFATGVAPSLWLGVGAAFVRGTDRGDVTRQALRLSARLGSVHLFSWGAISPAAGVGIVSARAWRELPGGSTVRDEEAGPFLEFSTTLDVALGEGWALGVVAQGRAHLPDDYGEDGQDPPSERLDPDPLPDVGASLGLRISRAFGAAP